MSLIDGVLWQREMSPIDRLNAFLDEQLVGFGEVFAAEEAAMRGQRRRMRTAQNVMTDTFPVEESE